MSLSTVWRIKTNRSTVRGVATAQIKHPITQSRLQIISRTGITNEPPLCIRSINCILLHHRIITRCRSSNIQGFIGIHIGNHIAAIGLLREFKLLRFRAITRI